MIAIDTNVLVRLLTGDDKAQQAKAEEIFRVESVFIPSTVFLETEWVLRFSYGYAADKIISSFRKVLGLANVTTADPELIGTALAWNERGVDFADALHLAASRECSAFITFDSAFIRKAEGLSSCVVKRSET